MKTDRNPNYICRTSRNNPGGFTLVEVLVVITIIVVLAALTFVMTRNMKAKAYQANAIASLRQVAAANVAYAAENNGDINTLRWVGDPKEGGGGSWVKNSFWGRIQPYLFGTPSSNNQALLKTELNERLDQLFNSPDADTMAGTVISGAKIYHDGSGLAVPIAFNANLHQWGTFLKVSRFDDPSRILYSTYGFGFFKEADGEAHVETLRDGSKTKNLSNIYYLDNRKALVTFLDGHVEALSPPIPSYNFQ